MSRATQVGPDQPLQFAGEQRDATGLYYLRARYYDPQTGRFVTRDPFPDVLRSPLSLHRFTYALNNPVTLVDPSGLDPSNRAAGDPAGDECRQNQGEKGSPWWSLRPGYQMNPGCFNWNFNGKPLLPLPGAGGPGFLPGSVPLPASPGAESGGAEDDRGDYPDPRFAKQLERQLERDGPRGVPQSLRSLQKRPAEHLSKLPSLAYKSSVEREIRTMDRQIETIERFIRERGL